MHRIGVDTHFLRLKWRRAVERWRDKAAEFVLAAKAGFDPNQPRVPAGNPDGGHWTSSGDGSVGRTGTRRRSDPHDGRVLSDATPDNLEKPGARLAQARRPGARSSIQIGNRRLPATLRQVTRYDALGIQARKLRNQVREIDPTWKPRPSLAPPQTARGAINERLGNVRDAEARLRELARQSPAQLIETYRMLNNSRDLFGREIWPRDRDVVSVTTANGIPYVGTNSGAPTYTTRDFRAGQAAVDVPSAKNPKLGNRRNPGQAPNNSIFHAEATALLRAARGNRGTLKDMSLEVHTDRPMCRNCSQVLPLLGRELGDPTVTFVGPNGARRTMRDGKWID